MNLLKKIKKGILKFILKLINIILVLFFILLIASFIDVNIHNNPMSPNYQNFSNWNIFVQNK